MPKVSVASQLKKAKKPVVQKPVWDGPQSGESQGGVTQSLLSGFLNCRERFRLRTIEGLKAEERFSKALEYGNMWHLCEEKFSANEDWEKALLDEASGLAKKFPLQQEEVSKWYNICKLQFPIYINYWKKHKDVLKRTPLMSEVSFHVPYRLPSGRVVFLRGKWDSVDLIGKGNRAAIYLQENKTKGTIDEERIRNQLEFDKQTMFYLIALDTHNKNNGPLSEESDGKKIKGVRYNVIRRPLSGGKGSIRQHKPSKRNPAGESLPDYYHRLKTDYIEAEPEHYFMRWKVDVSEGDINNFKRTFLNPILENLCDWWEWVYYTSPNDPFANSGGNGLHWRHPFGGYNPVDEASSTELDHYLKTKNKVGLERNENMFPEL